MQLRPFELERYFARYEFKVRHLLSASDCEPLRLDELLGLADDECLRWWRDLKLGYSESPGHPLLRRAIADLYDGVSHEQVMVAAPEEAIFIAMNTLVAPGDHVVVMTPSYQSLFEVARASGCDVTPWPLRFDGTWRLDLDAIPLTEKTRLLVLNFPHNPTGLLPSRSELDAILSLARERDLLVFSDEMYRLLEPDPELRLPSLCEIYPRSVTLSGLSKSFGLPGLRMGWLIARDPALVERWLAFKDYTTICNSAPSEVLAVIALRARASIVARNLAIIAANLAEAERFFSTRSCAWAPPSAGSVAFPRWLGRTPLDDVCARALERGLMIVTGRQFDFDREHLRLGLGRRGFPDALAELAQVI
jgi:aspartate/methionine/tyrosine aminotransferase